MTISLFHILLLLAGVMAILALFIIAVSRFATSQRKRERGGLARSEEAQMIQEIHRTIITLNKRLDNLETIVIERSQSKHSTQK